MTTSKMLSALIGPAFVAVAISMLLNANSMPALVEQASHDPALILVSGLITFVAGLAIVRVHNLWTGGWIVAVTILGWLFVLGGLARILFPFQLAEMAAGVANHTGFLLVEAVILLVLGGFLSLKGYGRG
jgi:hypothetical protein